MDDTQTSVDSDHNTAADSAVRETRFAILGESGDAEETASVTFDEGLVTITGIIMGRNGCYTARLKDVLIKDEMLIVGIESYEDAPEDEGCTGALIFIEYEATVNISGDLPTEVTVEHNGETVTTEQRT